MAAIFCFAFVSFYSTFLKSVLLMLKVKSKNDFTTIVEALLTVNEVCPMPIRQLDPVEIVCAVMTSPPSAAELLGTKGGNSSESFVSCSEKD